MSAVSVERDGHVAYLTLSRPEARNALSIELCRDIVTALDEVSAGDSRVLVLRGAGKVFCAGADFAAVSGPKALEFLPAFEAMLEAVARYPLPTIASIHGAALGGGLQLATVCDFRIATDDARLGIPSSRLGIVINYENVLRLVQLAGVPLAKEILMTGRVFSGEEAAAHHLVTKSVPAPDLEEATVAFATDIANNAPLSVQGTKRAIGVVMDQIAASRHGSSGAPEDVDALVEAAYRSEDLVEGLKAMGEKRQPRFEGR